MPKNEMVHHLGLAFEVNIAKWRMDDPHDPDNHEWCLWVFDRNKGIWMPMSECNRPGEGIELVRVHVFDE